ncbi:MAG: GntR family transcriptional regulator [Candidatus Eremiobacteraeota bacterium]|nr:GntR family transcriptional regulator [Candidatus Eremiobacteraeota bacterium]
MNGPFLVVDEQLEMPPYRQVVEQLRGAIERGDLTPDVALPTVRQLAGDLGIAPNTVARAYTELQNDGWLIADGRRGTRVAARPPGDRQERLRGLDDTVEKFVDSLKHRGFTPQEILAALRHAAPPVGDAGTT